MQKLIISLALLAATFAAQAQYVDANTAAYMRAQAEMRDIGNADSARRSADALDDMARAARQGNITIHNPNR